LSQQPGQAVFKKICAPCHTIGVGDRVGPDLRGVTQRRERAWLSRFIREPARMRAQQDPVALALAAKYPGVHMPTLRVSEIDAADLIAYIEAQTARLTDGAQDAPAASHQHHQH
jgi:protein SCO1